LPTILAAIILTSLATGAVFLALGQFRLGSLIRFIPYPVIGGFIAGTGWLLVSNSVRMMTGIPLGFRGLPLLLQPETLLHWLPGAIFGVALLVILRRWRHFTIMPAMLLGVLGLFYLLLWLTDTSISQATAQGWLVGPFPSGRLWPPFSLSDLARVNWAVLAGQGGNMASILIVGTIALLLNVTGTELATRQDLDLDRELRAAGVANLAAGLAGGMAGYHSISLSVLGHRIGAKGRLVGFSAALLCGAVLFLGMSLFMYFPKPILGGLILFLGGGFLVEWAYDTWFTLPRIDYALVLLILLIIGLVGFLQGVALGVIVSVILFVVNYSRINVVKHILSGANYQSNVDRPAGERRLLQEKGEGLYILKLQGFIFFGTANSLLQTILKRLNDPSQPSVRFILIDFHLVGGIDSSAVFSFAKLRQLVEARSIMLVFTQVVPKVQLQLKMGGYTDEGSGSFRIFPSLDYGVEWCENRIIDSEVASQIQPSPTTGQLAQILPPFLLAPRLMGYLERLHVQAGKYLIRQGAPSEEFYLIESGRLTVLLERPGGEPLRLRTIGAGTVVGEIGFYLGLPRTTSVVAEEPTILYRLTKSALREMSLHDPDVAAALHEFVARLLAERLVNSNKTVEVLLQ